MDMLRRLLDTVNNVWNTDAKERAVFQIRQNTGQHKFMTIEGNQLHLHSSSYQKTLQVKQSIVIEDLTFNELINLLNNLGYATQVMPGSTQFLAERAVTLLHVHDVPIHTTSEVMAYTSNVWRMLYPLARLLEEVEQDTEKAMQQMYMRSAKGKWLEYWASFFNIRRFVDETDIALVKRIILLLVNPKANNRSMEELLKIMLGVEAEVIDLAPGLFELRMISETTDLASTDALLKRIKAGGVDYIYNYYKRYAEDYNSYIADKIGLPKSKMDGESPQIHISVPFVEDRYFPQQQTIMNTNPFRTNTESSTLATLTSRFMGTMAVDPLITGDLKITSEVKYNDFYRHDRIEEGASFMLNDDNSLLNVHDIVVTVSREQTRATEVGFNMEMRNAQGQIVQAIGI